MTDPQAREVEHVTAAYCSCRSRGVPFVCRRRRLTVFTLGIAPDFDPVSTLVIAWLLLRGVVDDGGRRVFL